MTTPYRSIVVGTDLGKRGARSLDVAVHVAEALSARELHVVHVLHSPTQGLPGFSAEPPPRAQAEAEARLNALELPESSLTIKRGLRLGSPPRELSRAADAAHAQLIIMTGRLRRPLTELVLGSSMNTLVRIAHCPVLVANKPLPPDFDGRFRRVLAAVDLSPVSGQVLSHALNITRACGGALSVRSICEPNGLGSPELFSTRKLNLERDALLTRYEDQLAALVRRSPRGGVQLDVKASFSSSAREGLLRACEEEQADLLVIGSSGRNAWHRMVLGSTSHHLLVNAPCPVMVVPSALPESSEAESLARGAALDGT